MGRLVMIRKAEESVEAVAYRVEGVGSGLEAMVFIDKTSQKWRIEYQSPTEMRSGNDMAAALHKLTKQMKEGVYPEVVDFVS